MKTIDEYLEEQINEQLCQAILSGSRGDGPSKVKIRPVEIRGKVVYQASETVGTKVLHKNYSREELISYLKAGLQHDFSQLQASGMALDGTILVSKKGKMAIKTRRCLLYTSIKSYLKNRDYSTEIKNTVPKIF